MRLSYRIGAGLLLAGMMSAGAVPTDRSPRPPEMTNGDWKSLTNEIEAVLEQDDALLYLTDGVDKEDVIGPVAMSPAGTWLVMGLRKDGPANSGSVHVYRKQPAGSPNPWNIAAVLRHPDASNGDEFGTAVTIDCASQSVVGGEVVEEGCYLAASAPKDSLPGNPGISSVHVFRLTAGAWAHDAMIVGPERTARGSWGASLAIDVRGVTQPLLLIGDPQTNGNANRGEAYLWSSPSIGTWAPTGNLGTGALGPATSDGGFSGSAVALDWPHAVIGAPGSTRPGSPVQAGLATYMRLSGTFTEAGRKILACGDDGSEPEADCDFGHAVAVRNGFDTGVDGLIAVSSPGAAVADVARAGSVHVYRIPSIGMPAYEATYRPIDIMATEDGRFGESIALGRQPDSTGGQILLVGGPTTDSLHGPNGQGCNECGGISWIALTQSGNASGGTSPSNFEAQILGLGNSVALAYRPVNAMAIPAALGTPAAQAVLVATEGAVLGGVDFGTRSEVQRLDERGSSTDPLHSLAGDEGDALGYSVSVLGNFAAVGAPGFSPRGVNSAGAVYIFRRDAALIWRLEARVLSPERQTAGASARFGQSVALGRQEGATPFEYLVVGAPGSFGGKGTAYAFKRVGKRWDPMPAGHATVVGRFEPEPGFDEESQRFGSSVSTEGGVAAVLWDKRVEASPANQAVSVHEFDGAEWRATETIRAGLSIAQERVGASPIDVDVSGNRARIATHVNDATVSAEKVTVHERGPVGWNQLGPSIEPYVMPQVSGAGASFGWSVSLDGDRLAVGAPDAVVDGAPGAGAVFLYAFDGGSWNSLDDRRLPVPDEASTAHFGNALALLGGNLFVGSGFELLERGSAPSRVDWFAIDDEAADPYAFIDTFEPRRLGNSDAGAFAASIAVDANGAFGIGMPGFEVGLASGSTSHLNQGAVSFFEVDLGDLPSPPDDDGIFAYGFELDASE